MRVQISVGGIQIVGSLSVKRLVVALVKEFGPCPAKKIRNLDILLEQVH